MGEMTAPKVPKWPFIAGDLLLLGVAYAIYGQSSTPLPSNELILVVLCVALGALLMVIPFLVEYRGLVRVIEANSLSSVVEQVGQVRGVAEQISGATARWQNVQDEADKTAAAAKSIAERMQAELKAFSEFMQKVNDGEKATLRLELEKLRRGEGEWMQVLVRILDHVHALHKGALKAGQPNLIDQLGQFQNACRDAARRVGMVPFAAAPAEAFDPKRHQVVEGEAPPPDGARIAETMATGYTFQGRQLRAALVRLAPAPGAVQSSTTSPGPAARP